MLENNVPIISKLLTEFITSIREDVGPQVPIAVRVDNRDRPFCSSVLSEIIKNTDGQVFEVAPHWPQWMTFEPFFSILILVSQNVACTRLSRFNSTLPFVSLGLATLITSGSLLIYCLPK